MPPRDDEVGANEGNNNRRYWRPFHQTFRGVVQEIGRLRVLQEIVGDDLEDPLSAEEPIDNLHEAHRGYLRP